MRIGHANKLDENKKTGKYNGGEIQIRHVHSVDNEAIH